MALGFVGQASASADNVALPAFTAGDVAYVFAFRDGSTTGPSLPAGWTNITTGAANTCSFRLGYRILVGGDTGTGNWTNATEVEVIVLSGVDLGIITGAISANGSGSSTSMNFPALGTFTNPNGTSWAVMLGGHRTATDASTVALGSTTNRTPTVTSLAMHTLASVSAWSATAKTVNANSGWLTTVFEVGSSTEHDRVSQAPVEGILAPVGMGRVTQAPVETVLKPDASKGRVTQAPVEVIAGHANVAVLTQGPVEVIRQFIPPAGLGFQAFIID